MKINKACKAGQPLIPVLDPGTSRVSEPVKVKLWQ